MYILYPSAILLCINHAKNPAAISSMMFPGCPGQPGPPTTGFGRAPG